MTSSDSPGNSGPVVLGDRYEVHRRLARGGMAEVFLARDQALDRPVAVKILFPEFATDPAFVERFRREAQAAANLSHPNIVGVYDWGAESGTYYIVMEYVEGQSLAEVIRANGPLQPQRAAEICFEVAGALGAAHARGVVHRDVKPGNVLLSTNGHSKVTDFGIARALSSPTDDLTQTGSVMGTATYFSPEQAQGFAVDERSDLYSLGVVLYEMLCGRPPFVGETPVAIAYKHVQEWPPRPSQFVTGVPAGLEAIILKLMAKLPDQRYRSADDLRADLRRFLDGQLTVAEQEFANPAPVAAPVPAPDATMVNTAIAVDPVHDLTAQGEEPWYDDEAEDEDENKNRKFVAIVAILAVALIALAGVLIWSSMSSDVEQVAVPRVEGKVEDEARQIISDAEFNPRVERVASTDFPEGMAIGTNPAEGAMADKGSDVTIMISAGEETVDIPNLVDLTVEEAEAELRALNLTSTREEVESDKAAGIVVSTDPAEGGVVPVGGSVKLRISRGEVQIPSVTGLSGDEAVRVLNDAGFTNLSVSSEPHETIPVQRAIRTDPSGTAALNAPISIVFSSGSSQVMVPEVVGSRESDASAELQRLDFNVVRRTRALPAGDPDDGRVVEMSAEPGTPLNRGASVTITVGVASAATTTTTMAPTTTTTAAPTTTTEAP